MSSNLISGTSTGTGAGIAPVGGDNRYKSVQGNLDRFGKALDGALVALETLLRRMSANATRAEGVARDIAAADLEVKFVEITNLVSVALGGAAVEVRRLSETAHEAADLAARAKATHARLYGELDDIRSSRREKTPKPGFFTR